VIHRPKALFLDEPTVGLDPQSRGQVWDEVRRLREEGMTVFLTTHYLDEADALCDRVAIIDHGEIVAEGTPDDLKREISGDVVIVWRATTPEAGRAGTRRRRSPNSPTCARSRRRRGRPAALRGRRRDAIPLILRDARGGRDRAGVGAVAASQPRRRVPHQDRPHDRLSLVNPARLTRSPLAPPTSEAPDEDPARHLADLPAPDAADVPHPDLDRHRPDPADRLPAAVRPAAQGGAGADGGDHLHRQAYRIYVPGLLAALAIFGGLFTGFTLLGELRAGVIERYRVTPVSRLALLLGRALRETTSAAHPGAS
jgi:hypothetical protein